MSDNRSFGGAIGGLSTVPAAPSPGLRAPIHCGVPMEWRTPAAPVLSVYSFDTRAEELPPVWCCRCGFQLDDIAAAPVAMTQLSR